MAIAAPNIHWIYPDRGPRSGNTNITIYGEGFSPDDKITIWGGGTFLKSASQTGGPANAICCLGNYAFLACGISDLESDSNSWGVQVFNIEDATNPQPVCFFPLPDRANDILIVGDYAFVAAMGKGLQILNIQNPASPSLVTYHLLPEMALRLSVYGSYIYVTSVDFDSASLQILDISDPGSPSIIGSCPIPSIVDTMDVFVEGDYAYIAAGLQGLMIIDVSEPYSPHIVVSSFSTGGYAVGINKHLNHIYLSEMQKGISILDVSIPLSPTLISSIDTPGLAYNIYITQEYLYVADDYFGIEIFSNDPNNYRIVGFQATPGGAVDLKVYNENIYVADSFGGFQIVDAYNVENPSIESIESLIDNQSNVYVNGIDLFENSINKHLYVFSKPYSSQPNWFRILDVTDPKNILLYGLNEDIGYNPQDIAVRQGYAYLLDGEEGIQVFNVANLRNPQRVPYYDINNTGGKEITIRNDNLFLACSSLSDEPSFKIFSLDTKRIPYLIAEQPITDPNANTEAIYLMDDYAIVATGNAGIEIFDISLLNQPIPLYTDISVPGYINDITISGDFLCLTNKGKSVHSFNIEDVFNPSHIDTCNVPDEPLAIASFGHYLYLAEGSQGLQVLEIEETGKISSLATTPTLTSAKDVVIDNEGKYVYVAIENGIMTIDTLKPCSTINYIDSNTLEVITPAGLSPGTYHLTVTDPNGESSILYNGFTVGENHCPYINPINDIDILSANVRENIEFTIDAYDEDSDNLTYFVSLYRLPGGATLIGNVFSWTPQPKDVGFYPEIQIQVSDGECTYVREIMIFVFESSNTPPVLYPINDRVIPEGELLSFQLVATDNENDPVSFTAEPLPDGALLVDNVFFWTPDFTQSGSYTVTFSATEVNSTLMDSETIEITVENVNQAPSITVPNAFEGLQGVTIAFWIEGTDPDIEDIPGLNFSLSDSPEGANLTKSYRIQDKKISLFLWTPSFQQQGYFDITFSITDESTSQAQDNVLIEVIEVPGQNYSVSFVPGKNLWISPIGQESTYTSFDFLKELGEENISYIQVYDWDSTLKYQTYWFFGRPCGDNFPMSNSELFVVYAKQDLTFNWP